MVKSIHVNPDCLSQPRNRPSPKSDSLLPNEWIPWVLGLSSPGVWREPSNGGHHVAARFVRASGKSGSRASLGSDMRIKDVSFNVSFWMADVDGSNGFNGRGAGAQGVEAFRSLCKCAFGVVKKATASQLQLNCLSHIAKSPA